MKKSKKITIGVIIGLVFCAVAAPLLAVFLPPLFKKSDISKLVENQVVPSQGGGDFLKYDFEDGLDSDGSSSSRAELTEEEKVETIDEFAAEAMKTNDGLTNYVSSTISNILVDFFKNIKNSKSYVEKFNQWIDSIDDSWDSTVDSYKNQYGADWEFYFQSKELDPVGGNEDDWKRSKLFQSVNSEFDSLVTNKSYINLVDADGNVITDITEDMLFDPNVIFNDIGQPCNIKFVANTPVRDDASVATDLESMDAAFADFQSFIFDEYVKTQMPLVTSMVLFKHTAPADENGASKFFNVKKATTLNGGTDPVTTAESYIWQCFEPEVYSSDGTKNATAKYNMFVRDILETSNRQLIWNGTYPNTTDLGGAINIPVEYTDDSATLYLIKAKDVFDTSYTQYAAASVYKLNNLLFGVSDGTLPAIDGLTAFKKQGDPNVVPGNEIMSNFLQFGSTSSQAAGSYYFELPQVVKDIINDDPYYGFSGVYNGATAITDTVDVTDTPFIMTRDEAGVHIIGIDRYEAISAAGSFEEKLTEIKNTLLWRHLLSSTSLSSGSTASSVTGFSLDLTSEIQSYYSSNKNELILKYIISKQENPPTTAEDKAKYIFSDTYSDMEYPMSPEEKKLVVENEIPLFEAYFNYLTYSSLSSLPNSVREKVLALQTNYIGKSFGNPSYDNAFIVNGLAGMLPYERSTEANDYSSESGIYNDVYGTYQSIIPRFYLDGQNASGEVINNEKVKEIQDAFDSASDTFLADIKSTNPLAPKVLTYQSNEYSQYLLVSNERDDSSRYYASQGTRINDSIASWISSSKISNIVVSQKIEAYLKKREAGIDFDNYSFDTSADVNTIPSSDADALNFINSRMLYAYNISNLFSSITNEITSKTGEWDSFQDLYDMLANNTTASLKTGNFSDEQLNRLRWFLTYLYAFDYNMETKSFEFTKFRDYLLSQTENNGKAAFVWTTNENISLIDGYTDEMTMDEQFSFKPKMMEIQKNTYGYAYQNASASAITPTSTSPLLFAQDVTFDNRTNYWRYASPDPAITNAGNAYTGFLGIQFPSNTSSDLDSSASTLLFSSNARFFTDEERIESASQGVLYNIAGDVETGRSRLDAEISKIRNNSQKTAMLRWLDENFEVPEEQKDDVETLSSEIIKASQASVYIPKLKELASILIPDSAFERVQKQQLVNNNYSVQQKWKERYFGDVNTIASQVVVTQFNYDDVVELFNTSTEGEEADNPVIDENDKGINWSVAQAKGFLGVSPEAFFISAMDWFGTNSLYPNASFESFRKEQGKFYAYDRRINDLFGEDWIENYKKNEIN